MSTNTEKNDKNDKKDKKEKKKYKQDGEEGEEATEREIKMKLTKKEKNLRTPVHYVSERTQVSIR